MAIELSKASDQEVVAYKPYYREAIRQKALPYAISLYKQAEMIGERRFEGAPPISYVAVWRASNLPSDIILCRVTFDGDMDMSYEIEMQSAEFVGYLIDIVSSINEKEYADFPQVFYSKLFRVKFVASDGS